MDQKLTKFKVLIEEIKTYFKTQWNVSEHSILSYRTTWNKLETYLKSEGIEHIDSTICEKFLNHLFEGKSYVQLTQYEKSHLRVIKDLVEYLETGAVLRLKILPHKLTGSIGCLMLEYIQYRVSMRIAKQTAYMYELYLSEFLRYIENRNVTSINEIDQGHILIYMKSIKTIHEATIKRNIIVLRGFFKYLYEKNILAKDYSRFIPKDGYKNQAKLPSFYNAEEVEKLLNSIDRGNVIGKRDYAILLLAARLGLRASDIVNLQFRHLLWEQNCIKIEQFKTRELLELPLLPDVGNAIVDYLKYGRPQTNLPYVFIIARSPYSPLLPTSVYTIVKKCFERAKINTLNKKRGPHALRHSFVGQLLERKSILPVISEVLGHRSTESTRYYLSIDFQSLKHCALNVPPVAISFYIQKGGYFYE